MTEMPNTLETDAGTGSSRRGALAAILAGSALGLAALGAPGTEAAKNNNKNKNKKSNKGSKASTAAPLPSVRYVYKTTTFTNSGVVNANAVCPSGYIPIGGGFFNSIPSPALLTNMARLETNDWYCEFDGASAQQQATIIAMCLAASDDTTIEDTEHKSARHKGHGKGKSKKRHGKKNRK
ncbi:MAG: hypothetical protein QM692_15040 [Thermomicrobiales bacterium]